MPGKYRRRRRYRRKPYVRRPIASLGALAPDTTIVSLNTTSYYYASSLGFNFNIMDLNNPNKPFPDIPVQPRGYDQWAGLYQRAMVVGYHLRVSAFCNRIASAGSALVPDVFVLFVSPGDVAPDLDWLRMAELPDSHLRILPCNACDVAKVSTSGSVARQFGVKELDLADYSVTVQDDQPSSVPTRKLRAMVGAERFDSSLAAAATFICVSLIQRIKFFDAKAVPSG